MRSVPLASSPVQDWLLFGPRDEHMGVLTDLIMARPELRESVMEWWAYRQQMAEEESQQPHPQPFLLAPRETEGRHYVYRYFDPSGTLLYIGATNNCAVRDRQHVRDSPWRKDARRMEYDTWLSRDDALAAERHAIETEHPVYNVRHKRSTT